MKIKLAELGRERTPINTYKACCKSKGAITAPHLLLVSDTEETNSTSARQHRAMPRSHFLFSFPGYFYFSLPRDHRHSLFPCIITTWIQDCVVHSPRWAAGFPNPASFGLSSAGTRACPIKPFFHIFFFQLSFKIQAHEMFPDRSLCVHTEDIL